MADRVKAKDKPSEIKSEKSVSSSREADFSQSHHSPEEHTLFLQGMAGNQGGQSLFKVEDRKRGQANYTRHKKGK